MKVFNVHKNCCDEDNRDENSESSDTEDHDKEKCKVIPAKWDSKQ